MISTEDFNSLCPGDVVLSGHNPNVIDPFKEPQLVLVTRVPTSDNFDRVWCLHPSVDYPSLVGSVIPKGRPFAGRNEVDWYRHELDRIVSRGSEYYRSGHEDLATEVATLLLARLEKNLEKK